MPPRACRIHVCGGRHQCRAQWTGGGGSRNAQQEALRGERSVPRAHGDFAELTHAQRACMLQYSSKVRCVFVTTHVPYAEVPRLLTKERILDTLELGAQAMRRIGCIDGNEQKISVRGSTRMPASTDCLRREAIISPAIELARDRGFDVEGPIPPDTACCPARRAVLCCCITTKAISR